MRILLFVLMQAAVLVTVGIVGSILMALFGIRIGGGGYAGIFAMCAIFGCAGSLISLFMSKMMVKKAYGVRVIAVPQNQKEAFLVKAVADMAAKQGISMPEVGIYDSPDMNAFATGPSQNNSLVAVTSTMLYAMNEAQLRGVLGHEIAHIKNGDMVTMTLLQGILNTFVYFFSYIAAMVLSNALSRSSNSSSSSGGSTMIFHLVNTLCQIIFGIGASMILMWFSRQREYRADAGSAMLEGRECMISALEALKRSPKVQQTREQAQFQALCINDSSSLKELFMSHPPLDKRIAALRMIRTF